MSRPERDYERICKYCATPVQLGRKECPSCGALYLHTMDWVYKKMDEGEDIFSKEEPVTKPEPDLEPIYQELYSGSSGSSSGGFLAGVVVALVFVIVAAGGLYFAWENRVRAQERVIRQTREKIPVTYSGVLEIEPLAMVKNLAAGSAPIAPQLFSGSVTSRHESCSFSYTIPEDGIYRFQSDGSEGGLLTIEVVKDGKIVGRESYCQEGMGVTLEGLKAGEVIGIEVHQSTGNGGTFTIEAAGGPTITRDISEYNLYDDEITYTDQVNRYQYTVPRTGRYRMELRDCEGTFRLAVSDRAGNELGKTSEGITLKNLQEGEQIILSVEQVSNHGKYTLFVGAQKEVIEIDTEDFPFCIKDSLEYTDQRNVYLVHAEKDGEIYYQIKGISQGMEVELGVFQDDTLEEIVSPKVISLENHSSFRAEAGVTYQFQIRQKKGLTGYEVVVW